MADKTLIKSIQKKKEDGFYDPIPIGTDGNYVQMKSKLDLEEQLKLGGNKVTAIKKRSVEIQGSTYNYYQIIEWYANKPITIDTGTNLPPSADRLYITHTVQTNIYSDGIYETYNITTNGTDILVERELINNGQNEIVVMERQELNNYDFISITNIFNSFMSYTDLDDAEVQEENLLHQKYIAIEKRQGS